MFSERCRRCNKEIPFGGTRYLVNVEIVSAFDGFLPDYEEDESHLVKLLEDLEQNEELDEAQLENDVHQEFTLVLCRKCKQKLVEHLGEYTGDVEGSPPRPKRFINFQ